MAEQGHLLERIAYYLEMARQGALQSRFHLPTKEEYRAFVMGPEESAQALSPEAMDVERDTPVVESEQSPEAAEESMYRDLTYGEYLAQREARDRPTNEAIGRMEAREVREAPTSQGEQAEQRHYGEYGDDAVELLAYESDTPEFDDALDEVDPDEYESTRAIRGLGEYDLQTPLGTALEDDPDYTAPIVIDTSTSDGLSISEQLDAFEARLAALTQEQDFQQHIDRTEGMSY